MGISWSLHFTIYRTKITWGIKVKVPLTWFNAQFKIFLLFLFEILIEIIFSAALFFLWLCLAIVTCAYLNLNEEIQLLNFSKLEHKLVMNSYSLKAYVVENITISILLSFYIILMYLFLFFACNLQFIDQYYVTSLRRKQSNGQNEPNTTKYFL